MNPDLADLNLAQRNGQRIYTAPDASDVMPSKESEVFIGRIPRDCLELELLPVLMLGGKVHQFRLMLDFSGTTRGFGFCLYATVEDAERAVARLDGHEIRPGHRLGVRKSINNCRLLLGNIAPHLTKKNVMDVLADVEGFSSLELFSDVNALTAAHNFMIGKKFLEAATKQVALVEFEDHRDAALARRSLIQSRDVLVDWAVVSKEPRAREQSRRPRSNNSGGSGRGSGSSGSVGRPLTPLMALVAEPPAAQRGRNEIARAMGAEQDSRDEAVDLNAAGQEMVRPRMTVPSLPVDASPYENLSFVDMDLLRSSLGAFRTVVRCGLRTMLQFGTITCEEYNMFEVRIVQRMDTIDRVVSGAEMMIKCLVGSVKWRTEGFEELLSAWNLSRIMVCYIEKRIAQNGQVDAFFTDGLLFTLAKLVGAENPMNSLKWIAQVASFIYGTTAPAA